jgi:hypothetical protein
LAVLRRDDAHTIIQCRGCPTRLTSRPQPTLLRMCACMKGPAPEILRRGRDRNELLLARVAVSVGS